MKLRNLSLSLMALVLSGTAGNTGRLAQEYLASFKANFDQCQNRATQAKQHACRKLTFIAAFQNPVHDPRYQLAGAGCQLVTPGPQDDLTFSKDLDRCLERSVAYFSFHPTPPVSSKEKAVFISNVCTSANDLSPKGIYNSMRLRHDCYRATREQLDKKTDARLIESLRTISTFCGLETFMKSGSKPLTAKEFETSVAQCEDKRIAQYAGTEASTAIASDVRPEAVSGTHGDKAREPGRFLAVEAPRPTSETE